MDLLKDVFFTAVTFFSFNPLNTNLSSVNSLECVSMNNRKCKIKSKIISINTDEPPFHPYSIAINKCKSSSNTINDPYDKICVSNSNKNINVNVLNLISRTNETRHIE